jgi:hypothetical protein
MSIAQVRAVIVMSGSEVDMNCLLAVIKGEYREMPGLQLTKAQVRRLWALEPALCDAVLEALEANQFLRVTPGGRYVLAEGDAAPSHRPSSPRAGTRRV